MHSALFATLFAASRPVTFVWGILVPGLLFAFAFFVTWALYRHFARKPE
jgi:hypothetical protein